MLVLARKEGETIQIGESLVRVVKIKRGMVRLAIEANPDVRILRGELIGLDEPLEPLELAEA